MKQKNSGWNEVINLAKSLGYTWQEACKKLHNKNKPKTKFTQIMICAKIMYELELIKAGGVLFNYYYERPTKREKNEGDIHYVIRSNMGFYRDYLKENSKKADLSSDSTIFIKIREMYDKKIRRFKHEIVKQYESISPKPQELAQLQKANYSLN